MANRQLNAVLGHLRRVAQPEGGNRTDGQLLERFLAGRDEAAFELLVWRHGPMVWGVCRRVLGNTHDAEDAFQAAFLVLARKAAELAARESVGNFLYGVAYRTALKARAVAARRQAKEKEMARAEALVEEEDVWRDVLPLLNQELSRLPDKYREPLVLCDLEGQTHKEVARRFGCPVGTISGRLARARVMLAKRLARHGLTLPCATAAVALAQNTASATVPAPLVSATVQAAALSAAGQAAGAVSAPVAALTEGVLRAMFVSKCQPALAVVLAVGLLGAGWGVYQTRADDPAGKEGNKPAPAEKAVGAREKLDLPDGSPPVQVLASIDRTGKLVIKSKVIAVAGGVGMQQARQGGPGGIQVGGGAPGGGAIVVAFGGPGPKMHTQTYDLAKVQVFDTKGKKLDKKAVVKRLKKETVALASLFEPKVDPLHLRLLKDDTLVFVLPGIKVQGLPALGNKGVLPLRGPGGAGGPGGPAPGAPPVAPGGVDPTDPNGGGSRGP
jgi:RNA polymerase sigma factor (sigma-70 family)